MNIRMLIAIAAIFVAWSVMDFVIHGMILQSTYDATANLWRPMEEMKMGLMYTVTVITAIVFVIIYTYLISEKSLMNGIKFGVLFGLAFGISMGFGSYTYMPIPMSLAWSWFIGTVAELSVAGIIVGAIIKSK